MIYTTNAIEGFNRRFRKVTKSKSVFSNSTAILIILPILIAIAPQMGLNPYPFALGITMASGVSLSCPLASSTLGMSMCVGYKFKDYFKYGFMLDVVCYVIIVVSVPLIYGLTV